MNILSEINIFPVKSLGGVRVDSALVTDRGLEHDRRWMLVNPDGDFLTQREHPEMALLQVTVHDDYLKVQHRQKNSSSIEIPFCIQNLKTREVTVWNDQCQANVFSVKINEWFSSQLDTDCELVYMPDESRRLVDGEFRQADEVVSFADGFPLLLIGDASLGELNTRLEIPVEMRRFRPNLVCTGSEPFDEDLWKFIRIGGITFSVVKPCRRCVMTTIDPATAKTGKEPLQTLSTYRRDESGAVVFGQNLIPLGQGRIVTGQQLEVVDNPVD